MTTLSSITSSLERCWTAIRTINPEVRPAALVIYLHQAGDRKGHYWQSSWNVIKDNSHLDEVHISSHLFALDAREVFQTLLHEAVHSMAVTRKLQDTSRQGRYHNSVFAAMAHEIGLLTDVDKAIGVVTTGIDHERLKLYGNAIGELQQAIEMYQLVPTKGKGGKGKGKGGMVKLVCPRCQRVIRASQKTIDVGGIQCIPCHTMFTTDCD